MKNETLFAIIAYCLDRKLASSYLDFMQKCINKTGKFYFFFEENLEDVEWTKEFLKRVNQLERKRNA
jgi:hypothetical protein